MKTPYIYSVCTVVAGVHTDTDMQTRVLQYIAHPIRGQGNYLENLSPDLWVNRNTANELGLSLWRNRLARSTVNRKVGGSSPPRDGLHFARKHITLWRTLLKITRLSEL